MKREIEGEAEMDFDGTIQKAWDNKDWYKIFLHFITITIQNT